jgi:hypothetical protein
MPDRLRRAFSSPPPPASAAKKITGKLSQPGFTVIALDKGGDAGQRQVQAEASGEEGEPVPAGRRRYLRRARSGPLLGLLLGREGEPMDEAFAQDDEEECQQADAALLPSRESGSPGPEYATACFGLP